MSKQYLTNCNVVLPSEPVFGGSVLIDGDRIADVCPDGVTGPFEQHDLGGSTLMPGMIDLHRGPKKGGPKKGPKKGDILLLQRSMFV